MNRILFYDFETTGIPEWGKPSDDPCQPRITQIAAELVDEESRETLAALNFMIKPDGWIIPDEVAALTGITTERADQHGFLITDVLPAFLGMWKKSSLRCGHNESFDARMARIEMLRDGGYSEDFCDQWKAGAAYCTQAKSTKIVNTGRDGKKKTASLAEAYKFFTGQELTGAHNAATDVAACKAVYFGIQQHQGEAA